MKQRLKQLEFQEKLKHKLDVADTDQNSPSACSAAPTGMPAGPSSNSLYVISLSVLTSYPCVHLDPGSIYQILSSETTILLLVILRYPSHDTSCLDCGSVLRSAVKMQVTMQMSTCSDDVSAWMKANRLQLNTSKTEVLWCSSVRRQHQIPTNPVRIGNTSVLPVSSFRDFGVYLDADVTMRSHVTAVVRLCFAAL